MSTPSARDEILGRIRDALATATRPEPVDRDKAPPGRPPGLETAAARVERFRDLLEGLGGLCILAPDEPSAAASLAALARERDWSEAACSNSELVRTLTGELQGCELFDGWKDRERLLLCDVGITAAQAGVAETGSVLLLADDELHRETSLVPPVHVCILRSSSIVEHLGDALQYIQGSGAPAGHLATLITGPSRTADIELTLVVGVHGPKELIVLILEDDGAS